LMLPGMAAGHGGRHRAKTSMAEAAACDLDHVGTIVVVSGYGTSGLASAWPIASGSHSCMTSTQTNAAAVDLASAPGTAP